MVKKDSLLGVILILGLGLLVGCKNTMKITDFDGMRDLPRNPSRIVLGTNSMNFNEEDDIYGAPIEFEVQNVKIAEITDKLFSISYEAIPKNIDIDISPISRYLILYDDNGNKWTVNLGLRAHNGRLYSPVNDDELLTLLYETIKNNVEILKWTNNNAVYVTIKDDNRNIVYHNVEETFKDYEYKKIYVIGKHYDYNKNINYQLLFILNDNEQENFINSILQNDKVQYAYKCEDLPFEGYDNRKLIGSTNTIKVGEELEITIEGEFKIYQQSFLYSGIWVKTNDFNKDKTYTIDDFPYLNLVTVRKNNFRQDTLFLELAKQDYFNAMHASNILSRMDNIEYVNLDYYNVVRPIWQISDIAIVDFVNGFEDFEKTKVIGLKPGEVTINFDGVRCKIIVVE